MEQELLKHGKPIDSDAKLLAGIIFDSSSSQLLEDLKSISPEFAKEREGLFGDLRNELTESIGKRIKYLAGLGTTEALEEALEHVKKMKEMVEQRGKAAHRLTPDALEWLRTADVDRIEVFRTLVKLSLDGEGGIRYVRGNEILAQLQEKGASWTDSNSVSHRLRMFNPTPGKPGKAIPGTVRLVEIEHEYNRDRPKRFKPTRDGIELCASGLLDKLRNGTG